MLRPYTGEFLLIPIPMELSMDLCSHSCHYCFANLNVPDRKGNTNQVLRVLSNAHKKTDILSILINERYPVLISNLVDPFSKNNHKKMIPLIKTINEMGIPIAFQTKGGYGIDQVINELPKSHWYITIESDNNEDAKKLSPGAPPITERIKLAKFLKQQGHIVDVGINPFIPEYFKDVYKHIETLIEIGVDGLVLQRLLLNNYQKKALTNVGRERFSEYTSSEKEYKKSSKDKLVELYEKYEKDISIILHGYNRSMLKEMNYKKAFNKTFPIINDFFIWCFENKKDGEEVTFYEFREVLGFHRLFPENTLFLQAYLSQSFEGIRKLKMLPTYLKMDDILKIMWTDKNSKLNIANYRWFSYLVNDIYNDQTNIYNEDNTPKVIFSTKGFEYKIVDRRYYEKSN